MTLADIAMLLVFSVLLSGGQVLFKQTAVTLPAGDLTTVLLGPFSNGWFYAATTAYAAGTLFWIMILRRVPISMAYPFIALGFVLVPLAGWYFWQERLRWSYPLGALLILAGIFIIAAHQDSPH